MVTAAGICPRASNEAACVSVATIAIEPAIQPSLTFHQKTNCKGPENRLFDTFAANDREAIRLAFRMSRKFGCFPILGHYSRCSMRDLLCACVSEIIRMLA